MVAEVTDVGLLMISFFRLASFSSPLVVETKYSCVNIYVVVHFVLFQEGSGIHDSAPCGPEVLLELAWIGD